jgi:hypothetical protein
VFEVRILGALKNKSAVCSGYFDNTDRAAAAIMRYPQAKGVYITLNPVKGALLARASNRIEEWAKHATADEHITRRRWLLIDCDAVRISGISSNEAELHAANERAEQVRDWLSERGWCAPVEGMSGNGAHLLYRIDLPNDKASEELVSKVLKALHKRFSDETVNIDTSVSNASRISKVYGTMVRKGDDMPERPHRRARLVVVPEELHTVTRAQLEELVEELAAAAAPDEPAPATTSAASEPATTSTPGEREQRYIAAAVRGKLTDAVQALKTSQDGQKHPTLRDRAITCAGYLHYNIISESDIERELFAAVEDRAADTHQAKKTIQDGIAYGKGKPLTIEVPEQEQEQETPRQRQTSKSNQARRTSPSAASVEGEQAAAAAAAAAGTGGGGSGTAPIATIDITDENLGRATAQIWQAMQQSSYAEQLYRYGDKAAYLDDKLYVLERFRWRGMVNRVASFMETKTTNKGSRTEEVLPPLAMVQDSLIFLPDWLPVIERVSPLPVFDRQGSLQTNGYHAASKTLVQSDIEPIPMDVERARALLFDEVFFDFPFSEEADRANLLAYLLAPFIREMCGSVPLFLIDAAKRGTGKGLLNDLVHIIWTGEPAEASDLPLNYEEQRKQLTTHLLKAPLSVSFDDISLLSGHHIQRALTASTWNDRLLGRNEECNVPIRCIWAATGNNVVLAGDMPRRVVLIRLVSNEETPSQREGFKRSENELREWVHAHRRELVSACIALVQHGLQHGSPGSAKMGGFDAFMRTTSTILRGVGVEGFYANMAATFEREDSRQTGWKAIVCAWYEEYATGLVKPSDIAKIIEDDSECDIFLEGETQRARDTAAGKLLKKQVDAVFALDDGTRLQIKCKQNNKNQNRYCLKVLDFSPGHPTPPPRKKLPAGWRINHAGDGSGVVVAPSGDTHLYLGNEPDGIKLARKLAAAALWATRRQRGEPEPPEPTPGGGAPAELSGCGGDGQYSALQSHAQHSKHSKHNCTGSTTHAHTRVQEKRNLPMLAMLAMLGIASGREKTHIEGTTSDTHTTAGAADNEPLELPTEPAALAALIREALQPPPDYEAARAIAEHALNGQRAALLSEIAAVEQAAQQAGEEPPGARLDDTPPPAAPECTIPAARRVASEPLHLDTPDASADAAALAGILDESGVPAGWRWDSSRPYSLVHDDSGQSTAMDASKERAIVEALSIELDWRIPRAYAAYEAYCNQQREE